jgi:hypothetical protein
MTGHDVVGFIEFIIGAVVVLIALVLVLLVIVSRMPAENPLRRLLSLLIARLGVTAVAGALAIPVEPIPGLDLLFDIGAPVFLIYYWYKFFRQIGPAWSARSSRGPNIPPRP